MWKIGKFWSKLRIHFKKHYKKKKEENQEKLKQTFSENFIRLKDQKEIIEMLKEIEDLKKIEFLKNKK